MSAQLIKISGGKLGELFVVQNQRSTHLSHVMLLGNCTGKLTLP